MRPVIILNFSIVFDRFGSRIVELSGGNGNDTERFRRSATTLLPLTTSLFSLAMIHTRYFFNGAKQNKLNPTFADIVIIYDNL